MCIYSHICIYARLMWLQCTLDRPHLIPIHDIYIIYNVFIYNK